MVEDPFNKRTVALACALLAATLVSPLGEAQESSTQITDTIQSDIRASIIDNDDLAVLNEQEVKRYTSLMQGRAGRWYKDLDPVWVLGLFAETDIDRDRYALMVADIEHARVERELAFQRAYDAVWKERVKQFPIIDPARWQAAQENNRVVAEHKRNRFKPLASNNNATAVASPVKAAYADTRVIAVVRADCTDCGARLSKLRNEQPLPIDTYFVGFDDDDAIRQWALKAGVDVNDVKSRHITLNHDGGAYAALAQDALFAIYGTVSGEVVRLDHWEQ